MILVRDTKKQDLFFDQGSYFYHSLNAEPEIQFLSTLQSCQGKNAQDELVVG